ncbi:hypothetical protein IGI04_015811 [Brassica rapa subsp. trilocularis]|uniref:Rho termination factor-like N-terminal domain-containing protein n=1 Tax=Brassica rapa subsp. trilocularis TaxID=1813537 RepID=A0ABQ7MUN2_BRACM|nr:hypothetical protein IGI04_015811 [Brassica rapa subsp. trilocularis]
MSGTFSLNFNYVSGYALSDSKCFSNSAVSRRTPAALDHKLNGSLKCTPNSSSLVCRVSSGGYRRNPDFSRLNKHGINRQSEDRDGFDGDNSDMLSSRNGSLLSLSNSPKFQATSSPGPREKEIVELFRKVQAQLRARAAAKREDKKAQEEEEASKGRGKEKSTRESRAKKLTVLTAMETVRYEEIMWTGGKIAAEETLSSHGPKIIMHHHHHHPLPGQRQASEESRQYQDLNLLLLLILMRQLLMRQASSYSVTWTHKKDTAESHDEPEDELQAEIAPEYDEHAPEYESEPDPVAAILEPESDLHLDASSFYQEEEHNVTLDALSEEEESLDDADEEVEEEAVKDEDLSTLKLMELRGIAKSRGLKGFSKMKKAQLVELLSSDSS